MPNRLDIELTSARDDGSFTWRAAGARQPKGVLDGKILTDRAKVGDVLRVEAEIEIDGITILSVLPPKDKPAPSGRIQLLGSAKPVPAVTTMLVSEGGRGDRRDLLEGPRRNGGKGSRDRRPARAGDRRPGSNDRTPTRGGDTRSERRPRSSSPVTDASSGPPNPSARPSDDRRPSAGRRPDEAAARPGKPANGAGEHAPSTARRPVHRFEPGTAHRDELFATLAPEQRPIAERLAAGGIPAVRRAIAGEQERARSEGRPEVTGEAILTLAEQLAPSVKQATWLDRAEAAVAQIDKISLRDLRMSVAAAAPRDEAGRELDRKLREELDRRIKKLRSSWEEHIVNALEEGRVLQALRFSAQPPEPTARFPASLVERLAGAASAAMAGTTPVERWLALLEAAVSSPIRRQIHPEGLPVDPSGEVLHSARLAAGSLPALAPMLGLSMPPPPTPISRTRVAHSAHGSSRPHKQAVHKPAANTEDPAPVASEESVQSAPAPVVEESVQSAPAPVVEESSAEPVSPAVNESEA